MESESLTNKPASIASPSIAPATNTEGAMSQHEAGVFKHENGRVLSPREVNWRKTHGYYPFTYVRRFITF